MNAPAEAIFSDRQNFKTASANLKKDDYEDHSSIENNPPYWQKKCYTCNE